MRVLPAMLLQMMIAAVIVLGGLAGCAAPAASGQAVSDSVSTNRVEMPPSYRFSPPTIRVAVGATVTWTNHDNFTHNVHLLGGLDWVSQPLRPGESTSYTFTKAGTYPYLCDFHAHDMKGTVIVTAP